MPRYFFNIYDHIRDIDDEGQEFQNASEARAAAVVFAGDLLSERPELLAGGTSLVVEVCDESHKVVVTVTIAAADGPGS